MSGRWGRVGIDPLALACSAAGVSRGGPAIGYERAS